MVYAFECGWCLGRWVGGWPQAWLQLDFTQFEFFSTIPTMISSGKRFRFRVSEGCWVLVQKRPEPAQSLARWKIQSQSDLLNKANIQGDLIEKLITTLNCHDFLSISVQLDRVQCSVKRFRRHLPTDETMNWGWHWWCLAKKKKKLAAIFFLWNYNIGSEHGTQCSVKRKVEVVLEKQMQKTTIRDRKRDKKKLNHQKFVEKVRMIRDAMIIVFVQCDFRLEWRCLHAINFNVIVFWWLFSDPLKKENKNFARSIAPRSGFFVWTCYADQACDVIVLSGWLAQMILMLSTFSTVNIQTVEVRYFSRGKFLFFSIIFICICILFFLIQLLLLFYFLNLSNFFIE